MSKNGAQAAAAKPQPSVIAVLGGGYAGLFAARRAARALAKTRSSDARVVLVDSADDWEERTRWHQLAAGDSIPLRSRTHLFRRTRVDTVTGTVTGIDLDSRTLVFAAADHKPLTFDRLVYAAGSQSNAMHIPGAAEYAYTLDTASTSRSLGLAITRCPDSRVLVVGGGLTGIQTAAQIAVRHRAAKVTLVSSGAIGFELPDEARGRVDQVLDGLGVEVVPDRRIDAVEKDGARLSGGHMPADLVVWTAGFVSSPLAADAGLAVSGSGQVVVDTSLRSVSHPFVFAAGDGAVVARGSSAYGAYAATATSATAGSNAGLDLAGQEVKPLNMGYAFTAVSLGRGNAIVQLLNADGTARSRFLKGRLAGLMKGGIERYVAFGIRAERTVPGVYHWSPGPKPSKEKP